MKIEKTENLSVSDTDEVTVKTTGSIVEIKCIQHKCKASTLKLDREQYMIYETGEVKTFQHHETRADDFYSVSKSLKTLRDIINTNVTTPQNCLWITLTYRKNMCDEKRLYEDFRKFHMRFSHYLKSIHTAKREYIVVMEPQGRGAWHAHAIYLFSHKAPFIPNDVLADIWGNGFVKINRLNGDCSNIGAYLSAYLGDMELEEAYKMNLIRDNRRKVIEAEENGQKVSKQYVKGARMYLYPKGMRIFRTSRGIKKPEIVSMTNREAMETVREAKLTFEKTIRLLDDNGKEFNVINYRYFNSKLPPNP